MFPRKWPPGGGWPGPGRRKAGDTLEREIRAGNPERQGGLAYPPGNGSGEGGRKKGGLFPEHCARTRSRTDTGRKHTPRRGSLASVTPLRSRVANNAG